ncbi:MAG: hypothetical protein R3233_11640, partial [Xanthomonadales bacterium]|nr:hypothetical protein [Xanthomonadales bacterium]
MVNASRAGRFVLAIVLLAMASGAAPASGLDGGNHSVARQWNEVLLQAIRTDFARPTVHARNLFHVSGATWDAWAAYDDTAETLLHHEFARWPDVQAAREIAISYAAYRLLSWRFQNSPGHEEAQAGFDALMTSLGLDPANTATAGDGPTALGNRIAQTWILYGLADGANEAEAYANRIYQPVNPPLVPALPGNPGLLDFNRWQPLALKFFVDQAGRPIPGGSPPFLSPEWGRVLPFAMDGDDLAIRQRDGADWWVWHDPGPPPALDGDGDAEYRETFERVILASGALDPADGIMLDVSPASRGNNTLGTNDGSGYGLNPVTGEPYLPQVVPAGDYYRVLAEFWADGPDSETPPGHWFSIANYVADHPSLVRRFGGE